MCEIVMGSLPDLRGALPPQAPPVATGLLINITI